LTRRDNQNPFSAYALAATVVDVAALREARNTYWSEFKDAIGKDAKSSDGKCWRISLT
jgi:hypothetical protein